MDDKASDGRKLKELPGIVIAQTWHEDNEATYLRMGIKLIDPSEAVTWVATGRFYQGAHDDPRIPWYMCTDHSLHDEHAKFAGKSELAEELVMEAVVRGDVRCVRVIEKSRSSYWAHPELQLEAVDPVQWRGFNIDHNWEEGFSLQIWDESSDDQIELKSLLFLWDDVAKFRSWKSEVEDELHRGEPSQVTPIPRETINQSTRGRSPNDHGAAIALFLRRMVEFGIEAALQEKAETLGNWLVEEYKRVGAKVPNARNAQKDARAALRAWAGAAQSGANQQVE